MVSNGDGSQSTTWVVSASLTVLLTVGVGLATLLAAQANSDSADNYALSALALNDANLFYSQGIESVLEQIDLNDEYWADRDCLNQVLTAETADKCLDVSEEYTQLIESNVFDLYRIQNIFDPLTGRLHFPTYILYLYYIFYRKSIY